MKSKQTVDGLPREYVEKVLALASDGCSFICKESNVDYHRFLEWVEQYKKNNYEDNEVLLMLRIVDIYNKVLNDEIKMPKINFFDDFEEYNLKFCEMLIEYMDEKGINSQMGFELE